MSIASKKVATKKVVKKAATPKTVTTIKKTAAKKNNSVKAIVYADNEHSFWTHDGQVLNSLIALEQALSKMEKIVYAHHVTKDRHDFARWVEVVLADTQCAEELRKAKTASSAKTVVVKHLKSYTK